MSTKLMSSYSSFGRKLGAKHAYYRDPPLYPQWPDYMESYNQTAQSGTQH